MTEVLAHESGTIATAPPSVRAGGRVTLAGALTMLVGAALYSSSGADVWGAVSSGDMATLLLDAAGSTTTLYAGLTAWVFGVIGMAIGGSQLADSGRGAAARAARTSLTIGAAVAIPAFLLLASVTRLAGSGSTSYELADALAFLGTTLDDVATIIIIGLSPVLVAMACRGTWMPRWLVRWAWLAGVAGLLSIVAIFLGQSATLGFAIVPLGIPWMIASGVTAIRRG